MVSKNSGCYEPRWDEAETHRTHASGQVLLNRHTGDAPSDAAACWLAWGVGTG